MVSSPAAVNIPCPFFTSLFHLLYPHISLLHLPPFSSPFPASFFLSLPSLLPFIVHFSVYQDSEIATIPSLRPLFSFPYSPPSNYSTHLYLITISSCKPSEITLPFPRSHLPSVPLFLFPPFPSSSPYAHFSSLHHSSVTLPILPLNLPPIHPFSYLYSLSLLPVFYLLLSSFIPLKLHYRP